MASRQQRQTWINSDLARLRAEAWVWRNWIKNNYRTASQISYAGFGNVSKIETLRGDIYCVINRSPVIQRTLQGVIRQFYKLANETAPMFVDRHVFAMIQEAEHG